MNTEVMWILDDNGEPQPTQDVGAWGRWFENANEARRVGDDHIGDVRVSTVFIGVNYQFLPDREPILYETMIFGGPHDRTIFRYRTREEALLGHTRVVFQLLTGEQPDPDQP